MLSNNPKPFICEGCLEIIERPENFSKQQNLCIGCFEINKAIKENKCLKCKGENPKREYWGKCEKCFHKPISSKEYNESIKLEDKENRFGWEEVEDYLDRNKDK